MHGLFITDSGVRVRKPVESGCLRGENGLLPQDALALHAAASIPGAALRSSPSMVK